MNQIAVISWGLHGVRAGGRPEPPLSDCSETASENAAVI